MTTHLFQLPATVRRATAASFLALALFALTACTQKPQLSTQAAGHAITARIEGNGPSVENHTDGARLGSEFGQVTIERTRMRIEGESWVQIAEGSPVTLSIERGRIKVKAGNVSVGRSVSY